MHASPLVARTLTLFAAALITSEISSFAEEAKTRQPGDLEEVQVFKDDLLSGVTSVTSSPDGRFLYAAAFHQNVVATFRRNPDSGELNLLGTVTNPSMRSAVALRLSRDAGYAIVSAFGAGAITLLKRDKDTGMLETLGAVGHGESDRGLNFVIDAIFSPDNHFIYTGSSNGIGIYTLENEKLSFTELQNADGEMKGLRAVVLSPDGKYLYAAATQSNAVGVFKVDQATGHLELLQMLKDGEGGFEGLGGAFRISCSPDGHHVYINSGRFGGDNALTVCAVKPDGMLSLVEQHLDDASEMEDFKGGNGIGVSPDGHFVFALTTLSDRLFRFQREADTGTLISLGSQQVGGPEQPGCAGLCFSPDGRFVYVADENSSSIVVLKMP